MSPEQVRGEEVDTQSDVWAFGCVLYEMLTGRRAFPGGSIAEITAAVLRDEVDWSRLPADTPRAVRRLLDRCLRRDWHTRLRAIGDARMDLEEALAEGDETAAPVRTRGARRWAPWAFAAAALAAASFAFLRGRAAPRDAGLRLSLELPASVALSEDFPAPFALSPDGTRIAVVGVEGGTRRLYVRALDGLDLRPLAETDGATQPFFSPDGKWIGFFAERRLRKVPVSGGPAIDLAEVGGNPRGAAWAPGGTIVLSPSQTSGLLRVPDRGGTPPAPLTTLDPATPDATHRWPDILPGGKWVLYTAAGDDASFDDARLEAVSLETGERRAVIANASYGRLLSGDTLAFARAGRLFTAGFAPGRLAVRGEPTVFADGIRYDPRNGAAHLAASPSGTFVYAPAAAIPPERYVAWLGADGKFTRLVDTPRIFGQPRLSPDGARVALRVGGETAGDLWSLDLASGTLSRLSTGLAPHRSAWRPDGRAVTVAAHEGARWRLLTLPLRAEEPPTVLLETPERTYPNDWTPDGQALVLQAREATGDWNLKLLEVDGSGHPKGLPRPLVATPFQETNGAVSPDGTLLAHESDEVDGVFNVYVRSFPEGSEKIRASTRGGRQPRWGVDGRLFFWSSSAGRIESVRIGWKDGHLVADEAQPVLDPQVARTLARHLVVGAGDGFDPGRSGRFLVLESAADPSPPALGRPVVVVRRR
jgi:serine/threonine-protein kinase